MQLFRFSSRRSFWTRSTLFVSTLLIIILSCRETLAQSGWEKKIDERIEKGEFANAAAELESLAGLSDAEQTAKDWRLELMRRIRLEFPDDEATVLAKLAAVGIVADSDRLRAWETQKRLESRLIDGERRYFKFAVSNLRRLDPELWTAYRQELGRAEELEKRRQNVAKIIAASSGSGDLTAARTGVFTYVATVPANRVPAGETIRCWAPFPRESSPRQQNVKLLATEPQEYRLAPKTDLQRCVYLEKKAVQDEPTIFKVVFETTCFAQYFSQEYLLKNVRPYRENDELVERFTAERTPHLERNAELERWTKEIVGDETNPVCIFNLLFDAIDERYIWATSNEYGTMPDIPRYVLREKHGDCGMKALLLISALRIERIPAKWQSGWFVNENGSCGMHDWLEVYFEGIGWVPADVSFGRLPADDPAERYFYRSGHDQFRLIVNDDYGRDFTPKKTFFRSEPVDFQRGEIEWNGGNLYFPEWSAQLTVKLHESSPTVTIP